MTTEVMTTELYIAAMRTEDGTYRVLHTRDTRDGEIRTNRRSRIEASPSREDMEAYVRSLPINGRVEYVIINIQSLLEGGALTLDNIVLP